MAKKTFYLIFGIVIVLIAALIVYLVLILSKIGPGVPSGLPLETEKERVVLELEPSEAVYPKGQSFSVDILLDVQNKEVSGVDILLKYDPEILQVIGEQVNKEGSIFEVWPMNQVEKGAIKFSALTQPGQTFSGKGKVGSLQFKGLKEGNSLVSFDFTPGVTIDTNVASEGKDVLDQVIEANFTITLEK